LETDVFQAVVDGGLDVEPVEPRVLRGNEDFLPFETALTDRYASFGLVPVRLGGVY
jgi:hypothetical protein